MTCRERLIKEHPELVDEGYKGGCSSCPSDYNYMDDPNFCNLSSPLRDVYCRLCWDREIPEEATPITFDWSKLREFVDDSMKKRDRFISVYFHPEHGVSVNVYPWPDVEETEDSNVEPYGYSPFYSSDMNEADDELKKVFNKEV